MVLAGCSAGPEYRRGCLTSTWSRRTTCSCTLFRSSKSTLYHCTSWCTLFRSSKSTLYYYTCRCFLFRSSKSTLYYYTFMSFLFSSSKSTLYYVVTIANSNPTFSSRFFQNRFLSMSQVQQPFIVVRMKIWKMEKEKQLSLLIWEVVHWYHSHGTRNSN